MTPLYRSRPGGADIHPATVPNAIGINDFIYLSEGLSNSYLVVTDEGRAVINTGMGFEAPVHKRAYDAVDTSPIRYILFTQGHVDHVGGADLLRQDGTELVAQSGNQAHQAEDARLMPFRAARSYFAWAEAIDAAGMAARERGDEGPPPGQARPVPTITFDDRLELELGGLRFELLATPGGETVDSMVVWLPQHRICFTGNLFSALFGHFPNLVTVRGDRYRDALSFVDSLDRVLALEPEILLVGHHGPVEGKQLIREELTRLRSAVLYVHDETVKRMNAGEDVFTAMREIEVPTELEVGQGYGKIPWSVRAIWENYGGWFHQRSTTELYGVPAASVREDLVTAAGGPDPIAERARAREEAGEPLEAIHLAEIALAADPDHTVALEASLRAHERLLELSVNFWETAWLRREIGFVRERLGALPPATA